MSTPVMESREHLVAAQVRAEMARRGLKQVDLAAALGMTQQAVSKKYNGVRVYSQRDLWLISDWLAIPLAELLGEPAREVHPLDPERQAGVAAARRRLANSQPNRRYASLLAFRAPSHATHPAHQAPAVTAASQVRLTA